MISYESYSIRFADRQEPIDHWETWFLTPEGVHLTFNDAVKTMEKEGLPMSMIRPVPVAISKTMHEISLK